MTEELEIFLEDCDDQLQAMEDALLDMQENGASENAIGAIFRAVHTIKGSAGMFGFNDIVVFTHTGENLFESIRQGDIEIDEDMMSLFLLCKDHIDKLIQVQIDEVELDTESTQNGINLTTKLNEYINSSQEKETQEAQKFIIISDDITELTIYEVEKLKDVFIDKLSKNEELFFDMKLIQKIDMVGIQLLLSLVKSAKSLSKKVKFVNITDNVLAEVKIVNCQKALGI